MINITKEQLDTLREHIPAIDSLVQSDDVQTVLDAIDDIIVDGMLGNGDEPTDAGIMLQRVYNQIYNQN